MKPRIWTMKLATPQNWRADYPHHLNMVVSTYYTTTNTVNPTHEIKLMEGTVRIRPSKRITYKLTTMNKTYTVSLVVNGKGMDVMVSETMPISSENRFVGTRFVDPKTPLEVIQTAEQIIRGDNGGGDAEVTPPVPVEDPQLVNAWSYNYLTKIAHEDCKLVGIIRQVKHEHIALMKQETDFTCGPAAVQNLLRLLHIELPAQHDIAKELSCTQDSGTDPAQIVRYLRRMNVPFRFFKPGRYDLDRILAAGYVLLVEYQDYQDSHPARDVALDTASHFAVLIGYDQGYYYLIDPYHPIDADKKSPLTKQEKERFLADWRARSFDGSHVMENWGLVVKVGKV